jgi:hypothetical protein
MHELGSLRFQQTFAGSFLSAAALIKSIWLQTSSTVRRPSIAVAAVTFAWDVVTLLWLLLLLLRMWYF